MHSSTSSQRSGVVAGECATRTNHARENPQCDECAIQPRTPVRSLRWHPIQWVRQSAKRRSAPNVLTIDEVRHLLAALPPRERILVFLDVSTGLRQSELFGLQWQDIDFEIGELRVTRGVVGQGAGTGKSAGSEKARP